MNKKLIGYCGVDSGQIMIVDPCYALKKMTEEEAEAKYKACCDVTLSKEENGEVLLSGIAGFGVVTGSFGGDGNYPVYANYGKDGLVKSLTIKFN